jgi:hypothetical protein
VRVDMCRPATYICDVVSESPQMGLIDSNCRLLHGNMIHETHIAIIVNQ